MSLASYSDLQTMIASQAHRSDLTSIIPDLITIAEQRIYRDVRAHEMETAYSGAIASGVIAVPANFIGWKNVYVDTSTSQRLQTKTLDWLYQNYPVRNADGLPKYIARNGANFEFGPYPDSAYTIKGTYWKRLDPVATSWNALATAHPDLFMFAALVEAAEYIREKDMAMFYDQRYRNIVESINAQNNEIEFSGAPLAVTWG